MDARRKTPKDALVFIQAVASKHSWVVNPDSGFVTHLAGGLASNYNTYGYYLCPCRDGDGERELDADIICPCDYLKPDHEEYGHCLCGLFLTADFARLGKAPQPIPERRKGGI
jgi:ferredoxin-thioredoxin reductase catalytic subunit